MVSFTLKPNIQNNDPYDYNMPIAVYFCFPHQGIAVGLRPGDIIFFNPLYYHCASQKTSHYEKKDVFITSFYMKNKEMTGNDSEKIFTDSFMELCFNLDNDTQSNFVQQCNKTIVKNKNKKRKCSSK
jgi:hypothetical protein